MTITERLNLGDSFGGFTLLSHLGEGGLARVFLVRGPGGELGALKLAKNISPNPYGCGTLALCFAQPIAFRTGGIGPAPLDPSQILEREGRWLADLSDPAFPRVLAHGAIDDRVFVVYEALMGGSLRERMSRREPVSLGLFLEIGQALAERQEQGLLPFHGDLKPENVMFAGEGGWRLIDATCAAAEGTPLGARTFVTTPVYYPFLIPDDRPALALMMIEAMTGLLLTSPEVSFPARRLTPALQLWLGTLVGAGRGRYAQKLASVPRLDELSLTIGSELADVLLKALFLRQDASGGLDVDPGYPSWGEFLQDLRHALENNS